MALHGKYVVCCGGQKGRNSYLIYRGFGFVKFGEESEQKAAVDECQGTVLGGRSLRLSIAVAKR